MPLPTCSVPLLVSERSFSALEFAHQCVNLERSIEQNLGRLSEMESRSFWLDTIPLHECKAGSRAMSAQHPMNRPGNCRAWSEQLPVNISRNAGECPRSGWRNNQKASGQSPLKSA